ncbi:TonB-dependent receptor [Acetobacteraceae bacterium KSS8]|uniref:TonB-dependent receptor n=1 Tax=Endosaccharibacter trunci TaxID=2812733 RepID=A0ABT1W7Q6_9PROT|nr:TonB-dependent receptor [Acetobacteraceae bacterium KSS8]
MRPSDIRRRLFTGTFLCSVCLWQMPAFAAVDPASQTTANTGPAKPTTKTTSKMASSSGSEAIVVTGLSRRQLAQRAPVSVSIFSQQTLKTANVQNPYDLLALAPNVSIVQGQSAGSSFATIRGISQVRNGESPFAVVVDGVQQMDYRQFTQDLFDVSQIEVLRGPQGDLWGRNAIGGAIIINTEQGSNVTKANVLGGFGNGDDARVNLGASGPIVKDRVFYDMAFSEHSFGGLIPNAYLQQSADYLNEYGGRAHVRTVLLPELTADFRVGFDETRGGAAYYEYQPTKFIPGTCFLDASDPFGGPAPNANSISTHVCSNNRGLNTRDIRNASFTLTYDLPFATVRNVAGWVKINEYSGLDQFPYTASYDVDGVDGGQTQWTTITSWEDDLRISSSGHTRLRWMLGGYYLDRRDYLSTTVSDDTGQGVYRVSTTPVTASANPTTSFLGNSDHDQDFALYGHLSYDILKSLTGDFGYRYDWNNLNQYIDPISTSGVPAGCTESSGTACHRSIWFGHGQPKVSLSWLPLSNVTLYADYGIGFRSGHFNQPGTAQAAHLPGVADTAQAESAQTVEAGVKGRFFDDRLTAEGSVFRTWDRNPFYFLFVGALGAQILVNIDQVVLTGGELQLNYKLLPGLDVFANAGYTNSRINRFTFNPNDVGNWAPYVPNFTADVGLQYRRPITQTLAFFGRFDAEFKGKQYWDPENSTARRSFELYNLNFGVESVDRRWSASIYMKNMANYRYAQEFVDGGFVLPAEPRMVGGQIAFKY